MKEVLSIIYTSEFGQQQLTIPLKIALYRGAFMDKNELELFCQEMYIITNNLNSIDTSNPKLLEYKAPAKLYKISTSIFSEKIDRPCWYGNWDGKFYYENPKTFENESI